MKKSETEGDSKRRSRCVRSYSKCNNQNKKQIINNSESNGVEMGLHSTQERETSSRVKGKRVKEGGDVALVLEDQTNSGDGKRPVTESAR